MPEPPLQPGILPHEVLRGLAGDGVFLAIFFTSAEVICDGKICLKGKFTAAVSVS